VKVRVVCGLVEPVVGSRERNETNLAEPTDRAKAKGAKAMPDATSSTQQYHAKWFVINLTYSEKYFSFSMILTMNPDLVFSCTSL
jgi:hypothetical protein